MRIGHPSERALHRFVDGEDERARAHVASCATCARTVAELRRLGDEARGLGGPRGPAPGLLEGVLARRAAKERTILPVEATARASGRGRRRLAAIAALAAVLLGLAAVLVPSRDGTPVAASRFGTLALTPVRPRAGAVVEVRYRASGTLQGAERLALRGQWWRGPAALLDREPSIVAELVRAPDGTHRGRFAMPSDARLGAVVVELPDGSAVESPDGGYGLVIPSLAGGAADPEGLRLATLVTLFDRHSTGRPRALGFAEEYVDGYPTRPSAWELASMVQGTESKGRDIVATYTARWWRLRRLAEAAETRQDVPLHELMSLANFAANLEEPELARSLVDRVVSDTAHADPRSTTTVARAVVAASVRRERGLAPEDGLAILDRAWARAEEPKPAEVTTVGLRLALRAGDTASFARWQDRARGVGHSALAYARSPTKESFRPYVLTEYRRLLGDSSAALQREPGRALGETVAEWERSRRWDRALLLLNLGRSLREAGALRAALDTMELANRVRPIFLLRQGRELGELRLLVGDSAGAMLAFAIDGAFAESRGADIGAARRDSVRRLVGRFYDDSLWRAGVDSGHALRLAERRPEYAWRSWRLRPLRWVE